MEWLEKPEFDLLILCLKDAEFVSRCNASNSRKQSEGGKYPDYVAKADSEDAEANRQQDMIRKLEELRSGKVPLRITTAIAE